MESLQACLLPPARGPHPSSSEKTGCIRPFRITFGSHFLTAIQDNIFRSSYTGIWKKVTFFAFIPNGVFSKFLFLLLLYL